MLETRGSLFAVTDLGYGPGTAGWRRHLARIHLIPGAWEQQVCVSITLMAITPIQHYGLVLRHIASSLSLLFAGQSWTLLSTGPKSFLELFSLKTLQMLGEFYSVSLRVHNCVMST